jgi:tripartite-type tricarboxylate transporter receptor subunit TctC
MSRLITAAVVLAASLSAPAIAQKDAGDYPNKPVRVIVAVAPGGGIDTAARILTERVRQVMGQPFVIDNRGGAAGNVGAGIVYNAAPDGYTILASSLSPITIADLLSKNVNFKPSAFQPIVVMSRIPNVLVVRQNLPVKSVKDLLGYINANAGRANYASPGKGTAAQLSAELFMQITGTRLIHIPYKGTAPSLVDLVGGHVDLTFAQIAAIYPLHRDGRVKLLATATTERLPFIPEIPTLAEVGVRGAESETWNAISAPPGTPAPIIAKLNAAYKEALGSPEVLARYKALYMTPGIGDLAAVRKYVKDETARWSKVIRTAGIQPD